MAAAGTGALSDTLDVVVVVDWLRPFGRLWRVVDTVRIESLTDDWLRPFGRVVDTVRIKSLTLSSTGKVFLLRVERRSTGAIVVCPARR